MISFIQKFIRLLLAPPHCASCKIMLEEPVPLCFSCKKDIRYLVPTSIPLTPAFTMTVYALGAYEGALMHLVRAKQYRAISAAQQLGELVAEHMREWNIHFDCVVPVPLHWRRYAWRGYNQAAIIGAVIAQERNIPLVQAVSRTKHTPLQLTLPGAQRKQNVKDVFVLQGAAHAYQGKHILLIDDLLTTGATLEAVAKALLPLKPASISAFVASKVV